MYTGSYVVVRIDDINIVSSSDTGIAILIFPVPVSALPSKKLLTAGNTSGGKEPALFAFGFYFTSTSSILKFSSFSAIS